MTHETIPVELAFIFVILAFVAGYRFRAVISIVARWQGETGTSIGT
jgi:hypothetical protein